MAKLILFLVLLYLSYAQVRSDENNIKPISKIGDGDCSTVKEYEEQARAYLENYYEKEATRLCQLSVEADWNYNTDLANPDKEHAVTVSNIVFSKFQFDTWNSTIRKYDYSKFEDPHLRRQFKFLNYIGIAALDDEELEKFNTILGNMARTYGTAKICPYNKQNCDLAIEGLNLDPEIQEIISSSRDSQELAYVWDAWRNASGKPIREMYKEYIGLSNKAAVQNGLPNNGDLWLVKYEADDFRAQVKTVWETVRELYVDLYGYVRFKLRQTYPADFPLANDPIPAHLLGNMWAQQWNSIYSLVIPFPDEEGFDVTDKLKAKFEQSQEGVTHLFQEANEFFTKLGLSDMTEAFGDKAMIIRPPDGRAVTCHASAWDFCDGKDYRIKMCTSVNQQDYATVHHELGHIQYFMTYKNQPIVFREGANPGFHEAIGDVLSLSVATPKHMAKLGYLEMGDFNPSVRINFLMQKALEKIAFLPFGYLIDAYRWKLFDGSASLDNMEYEWLKIRNEIQGVVPPVKRTEEDFDPGAKFHVPANSPYISYFVSFIIQFQIHKALCIAANQYDPTNPETEPLYNCDIDENLEAGEIMKSLLEKGFSENWQDVLDAAIGAREMDGAAIKEYFEPLSVYLKEQQALNDYPLDWPVDAFEKYYENIAHR